MVESVPGDPVVVAPLVVALAAIAVTLVARRWPRVQRWSSVVGGVAYVAAVALLAWTVVVAPDAPGGLAYQLAGWPAPVGITLVADALSAFVLSIVALVALPAVAFSVVSLDADIQRVFYHPLYHVLLAGITGAVLTGDLFNLFVWFEVMLMASYVYVSFYGNARHTAAAFRYLVVNVVGSALMLLGIGGLYAVTGTLNMAEMARRLADPAAHGIDPAPTVGLSLLLFAAFALKAGLVPFQFWVPGAYRSAPLPVVALLAGAAKKVGIYAILRLYFTVFAGAPVSIDLAGFARTSIPGALAPVLFAMAVASILLGGLGAVSRESVRGVLAYSSIGQVGFIAVPIAIAAGTASETVRHLGVLAALVYALHHALAKGMLFLVASTIRQSVGTTRFAELGGLRHRSPALAGFSLVGFLSLVGIPPLTGFFGKFLVFESSVRRVVAGGGTGQTLVLASLFVGTLLTIAYATASWIRSFWGPRRPELGVVVVDRPQLVILASLVAAIVLLGVGFDPVYRFADAAAEAALDREAYVAVVDPGGEAA